MINEADTYCSKCIKADVCGMEGVYDPAMTYCVYRVEARPQGEWNILQKDDNGIHEIECPFCKYSKGGRFAIVGITFHKLPPFCEACGAAMGTKESKQKKPCPCDTCGCMIDRTGCQMDYCEEYINWKEGEADDDT